MKNEMRWKGHLGLFDTNQFFIIYKPDERPDYTSKSWPTHEFNLQVMRFHAKTSRTGLDGYYLIGRHMLDVDESEWEDIIKRRMDEMVWGKTLQFVKLTEDSNVYNLVWTNKTSRDYSFSFSKQNIPLWLATDLLAIGVIPPCFETTDIIFKSY